MIARALHERYCKGHFLNIAHDKKPHRSPTWAILKLKNANEHQEFSKQLSIYITWEKSTEWEKLKWKGGWGRTSYFFMGIVSTLWRYRENRNIKMLLRFSAKEMHQKFFCAIQHWLHRGGCSWSAEISQLLLL